MDHLANFLAYDYILHPSIAKYNAERKSLSKTINGLHLSHTDFLLRTTATRGGSQTSVRDHD
jgi:hypothetical protein